MFESHLVGRFDDVLLSPTACWCLLSPKAQPDVSAVIDNAQETKIAALNLGSVACTLQL